VAMSSRSNNINVSIEVHGPVENSEIVGVRIERPGDQRHFAGRLFTEFFVEFLGLPSSGEIKSRVSINRALRQGRVLDQTISQLWTSLLHHMWLALPLGHQVIGGDPRIEETVDGSKPTWESVIRLHGVHLCEFVNRNPGYQYAYPAGSEYPRSIEKPAELLIGSPLLFAENIAAREGGLGDVRFSPLHGYHLLSAVPVLHPAMQRSFRGRVETEPIGSKHMGHEFSGHGSEDLPWLWDSHTAYGFPMVLSAPAFKQLAALLDEYGRPILRRSLESYKGRRKRWA
jgi:hypothetical protein